MHSKTEILVAPSYVIEIKRGTAGGTGTAKPSASTSASRIVTGVCAVFGNADSTSDVMMPGSFKAAIAAFNNGTSRVRHLWNHSSTEPPVARILELRELTRAELPAEMKSDPDIAGGLLVRREYLKDYYSDRIFQAVKAQTIREMSFAFTTDDYEFADRKGKRVREVKSVELFDTSDVVWGANSATSALCGKAVILNAESIAVHKEKRQADIERREKLEALKYYTKHLPRKPITRQQWANQMRLNKLRLDSIRL